VGVLKWRPPDSKPKSKNDGDSDRSFHACQAPSSGYRTAPPRRSLRNAAEGGCDFFAAKKKGPGKENAARDNDPLKFKDFSSLELDADDSLLGALRSPEDERIVRNTRKPFIPKVLNTTVLMGRRSLGGGSVASSSHVDSILSTSRDETLG